MYASLKIYECMLFMTLYSALCDATHEIRLCKNRCRALDTSMRNVTGDKVWRFRQPSESVVLNFLSLRELKHSVSAVFINGPYKQRRAEDSAVYAPRVTARGVWRAGRLSTHCYSYSLLHH